ncbi:MAG: hypothetical protein U9Q79_10835, partial [Candidatus Hydrogenedentes bacterium]|nr:hypothetical protein [Candidatus Hydrogenedentota bacterium]
MLPFTAIMTAVVVAGAGAVQPLLAVANKHDDTLVFIDIETLEMLETISTGPNPHEMVITPDQRVMYLS